MNLLYLTYKVAYPRESRRDASCAGLMVENVHEQARGLNNKLNKMTPEGFMKGLRRMYWRDGRLDFEQFGIDVAPCWNIAPQIQFLNGVLTRDVAPKERKARERATQENSVLVRPDNVVSSQQQEEEPDDVTRKEDLLKVIAKRSPMLMFDLVNPVSFSQTVENIFDLSFLVKANKVGMCIGEERRQPYIYTEEAHRRKLQPSRSSGSSGSSSCSRAGGDGDGGDDDEHEGRKKQFIMGINLQIWKQIIDVYGITECHVGHRDEEGEDDDVHDGGKTTKVMVACGNEDDSDVDDEGACGSED